jgi:hypothetical protein
MSMEPYLAEEERESLIAAPFFLIDTTEITSRCDVQERGLLHGWHGPRWKCAAFPEGKFGVRIWRF